MTVCSRLRCSIYTRQNTIQLCETVIYIMDGTAKWNKSEGYRHLSDEFTHEEWPEGWKKQQKYKGTDKTELKP